MAAPPYAWSWFDRFCLWYPPGWLILFNRHWQHYHADPDGWIWPEYLLFLVPGGFYLALLLRWLRLGCRPPRLTSGTFDPGYQAAFRDEILAVISKHHFRAELHQIDHLPAQGPLIVTMNHAGMCFPWDFLCLGTLLGQARGWTVQPLADVSLFQHPWMRWWLPPAWSQALGGVQAQAEHFADALANRPVLLYAPEGLRGPRKGWRQRYRLQRFHPSFIRLSERYRIPILPVICWGNESLHPWTWNFEALAKRLRLPFLPLSPLMLIFLFFPSMGVWAMPTKLSYFIQELHQPWLESPPPRSEPRRSSHQAAVHLRDQVQNRLDHLLKEAGDRGSLPEPARSRQEP